MANKDMNIICAGQDTARPAPKTNTITCGDCLEVMQSIPDKSVDMILCDLPYGMVACNWDKKINLNELFGQYRRICNGAICLTSSYPFTHELISAGLDLFKYEWVWEKNKSSNYQLAKKQPLKIHEQILVFYKKAKYYPQKVFVGIKDKRKTFNSCVNKAGNISHLQSKTHYCKKDDGTRYPTSVLHFSVENRMALLHPSQKPVALFEYLIRTYTNEGDTVLDNCIGSGTTAIACINTGRNFIGIEKEEKYCRIAEERIHALRSPAQNTMEICHTAPNSASAT